MYSPIILFSFLLCFACTNAQIRGIWYWTWSSNVQVGDSNLGVAFSGWVDPDQAISDSSRIINNLPGEKYIALGGGNGNGRWSATVLQKVSDYCSGGKFSGYQGVAFDIEEGDAGLASAFANAFSSCKSGGYKVLVTVSHSSPYGITDAGSLMASFFSGGNVDYFSPQLYSSGTEATNDYSDATVSWSQYSGTNFIPSIVTGSYFSDAQSFFSSKGIHCSGYVQWSQTATGSPPSNPSNPSSSKTVRCGPSWSAASGSCGPSCSQDGDCPSGHHCYANLPESSCQSSNPPPSNPPPSNPPPSHKVSSTRCGASWGDANGKCDVPCSANSDCSGSYCWAALDTSPCSRAVSGNSNTFTEAAPLTGKELTPMQIGFVVGGCVIFVMIVVVVVYFVVNREKSEEKV